MRIDLTGALVVTVTLAAAGITASQHPKTGSRKTSTRPNRPAKARVVQLDLDRATAVSLPGGSPELKPAGFATADRRSGWVVRIPGNRPIATPAYSNGRLFVGGGYGSHEFYAFNADTGDVAWKIHTSDDGPSAAVVEEGCVAFNTESCTVCVVSERTGRLLWQEWLGDPLMSQPAISHGKLYMAYPAGGRAQGAAIGPAVQQAIGGGSNRSARGDRGLLLGDPKEPYRLLCADLQSGRHIWTRCIAAEVISAPVIEGDRVLLTCMDGTSYSINTDTGALAWTKRTAGTSAPLVVNGHVVVTRKEERGGRAMEGLVRMNGKGEVRDKQMLAEGRADYLSAGLGGQSVGLNGPAQKALDSSVGFGGGAPAGTGMAKAQAHLNVGTVAGGWAYQGSRVAYKNGQLMNAQGVTLNSLSAKDGQMAWQAKARGRDVNGSSQVFSPPALGARRMYLCTTQGHLLAVNQSDGKPVFLYNTRQPMAFQPALARGNVYVGTVNGLLICLKTGSADADGWTAWGGNAQHNKK